MVQNLKTEIVASGIKNKHDGQCWRCKPNSFQCQAADFNFENDVLFQEPNPVHDEEPEENLVFGTMKPEVELHLFTNYIKYLYLIP